MLTQERLAGLVIRGLRSISGPQVEPPRGASINEGRFRGGLAGNLFLKCYSI